MPGIKKIGTRFDVFKDLALSTKSGLLKEDLVWYNKCVITKKEHLIELEKEKQLENIFTKLKNQNEKREEITNSKGPFIRPNIRLGSKYHN